MPLVSQNVIPINFVFLCLFCLCSISSERPEACQHRAPPWYHPHQGNPDSGLWICGEAAHYHAIRDYPLDPLWTVCRHLKLCWESVLCVCLKIKEPHSFQGLRGQHSSLCLAFDWFNLSASLLTEFQFLLLCPQKHELWIFWLACSGL